VFLCAFVFYCARSGGYGQSAFLWQLDVVLHDERDHLPVHGVGNEVGDVAVFLRKERQHDVEPLKRRRADAGGAAFFGFFWHK